MAVLTHPGVYVDEVPSGVRPLEVASTSTAVFVGITEMGPLDATRITGWSGFQRIFGGFVSNSFLAESVFQYFNNGGRQCYIVRVQRTDAKPAGVTIANRASRSAPGVTFKARSAGAWGNHLVLQIEDGTIDPANEFKISVRRQADADLLPDGFNESPPIESFDNLTCDPTAPRFVESVLTRESDLLSAAVHEATEFQQGVHHGGPDPVLPLGEKTVLRVNLDGDGLQIVTLPPEAGNADLTGVAEMIEAAVRQLTKKKASTDAKAYSEFTCVVETTEPEAAHPRLVLRSGTRMASSSVRVASGPRDDATAQLKLGRSQGVSSDGSAVRRPANAAAVQVGDAHPNGIVIAADLGSDGESALSPAEFGAALPKLDTITDISLLAVPGVSSPVVMNDALAYCINRPLKDIFFIGETSQADQRVEDAEQFRAELNPSSYGALYFPWVKTLDPAKRTGDTVLLPPSGFVAGLYSRIDAARGVWKAPAGAEARISGAVGLSREVTDVEHGNLNGKGVCVLRRLPGAGIVAFGARTTAGPSEVEWKYIPIRRMAMMLRVSIYNGIQWAVFEPNDEPLWSQLRLNIGAFMSALFRKGAFQGASTSEAFFVRCDGDTTTQSDIDLGIVNVEVGFAPVKPAEFVVVRISQNAGLASS
ncbi:MAG: phage tail sheath family protein [Pseudonocardia sp.]|nr:MAG: phage tail sheath family protein [Pseudonocardia sp.]